MDFLVVGVGAVLCFGGLVGCFLPVLPGPGLCYLGLLTLQLRSDPPFEVGFLLVWGGITALVVVFDYVLPPLATKKFGGSKKGILGSVAGLVIGIVFFPPFGILIGPMVGALIGEILNGKSIGPASKAAIGSLFGFLAGALAKVAVCLVMIYYFITGI